MTTRKRAMSRPVNGLVRSLRGLPRWSCTIVHMREKRGKYVRWTDIEKAITDHTTNNPLYDTQAHDQGGEES